MKVKVILLGLVFLCGSALAAQMLDKVVVVVNDGIITQQELNHAMASAKQQLLRSNTPMPPQAKFRKQVLSGLIDQRLMEQMVKAYNVKISDTELNQAISSIAKQNNVTLQQMKDEMESQGMNYAEYRKQLREQVAISRLQQSQVGKNINVSDQEVETFTKKYKDMPNSNSQYRLEDILIPTPDNPSPQQIQSAKKLAGNLLKQAKQGKNFRELAAANSGGKQALQGGDLGWRTLPELPTVFADAVKNMQTNDVVGPLKAPNGFHLIKLVGVRNSKSKLSKEQVRKYIFQRKFEEQLQVWMRQVREEAYIKFEK